MSTEKFLTVNEVAKRLRVSERSAMRYIKAKSSLYQYAPANTIQPADDSQMNHPALTGGEFSLD